MAVSPISASAGTTGVIALLGQAGPLTCVPGALPSTCPATGGNGVAAVGGHGTYGFTTAIAEAPGVNVCAYATAAPSAGTCSATSNGNYNNVVVGTGDACGAATVTPNAVVGGQGQLNVNYAIYFAAGVGVLVGNDASADQAAGVVNISADPEQPAPSATGVAVTRFNVLTAAVLLPTGLGVNPPCLIPT